MTAPWKYTVPVKPGWVEEARAWGKRLGPLSNSITNGEHNWVGKLCQIAYAHWANGKEKEDYQYDVVVGKERDEVKGKLRNVPAQPHYRAHICAANTSQKCSRYVFCNVYPVERPEWVEILGWLSPDDYYRHSDFWKKGHIDPDTADWASPWEAQWDCYALRYQALNHPQGLRRDESTSEKNKGTDGQGGEQLGLPSFG